MKTYVYFHVGCVAHWEVVFEKLIALLHQSGLYDKVDKIKLGVLTTSPIQQLYLDKIEVVYLSSDLSLYETPTIQALHEHAQEEDFYVLYIHSKGVTRQGHPGVVDWTRLLAHFNIERHEECIAGLEAHDVVGVNLGGKPLHYSGNFWWSKSTHLRTLPRLVYDCYNAPEYWVTSGPGKYLSLWESCVNHYEKRYLESEYMSCPSKPYTRVKYCNMKEES